MAFTLNRRDVARGFAQQRDPSEEKSSQETDRGTTQQLSLQTSSQPSLLQRRSKVKLSPTSDIESIGKLPLPSSEQYPRPRLSRQGRISSENDCDVPISPKSPFLRRAESTPLLTPPEELTSFGWRSNPSAEVSLPHTVPEPVPTTSSCPTSRTDGMPSCPSTSAQGLTSQPGQAENRPPESMEPFSDATMGPGNWLDRTLEMTVPLAGSGDTLPGRINLLSQTLPNPLAGESRPRPLFLDIVSAIQSRYGPARTPYITICHAVSANFELPDLPTSPPSTPNLASGQADYFSQTIFAHAAAVPPYHAPNSHLTAPIPASPNTIVAPASVQFSVLERLIPSSTLEEGRQLFSLTGRSPLIDRIAELSPDNGTLLFLYPTRSGATTFQSQYQGPVVDPVLRYIVELHGLSYEVAEELSSLSAISEMSSLQQLKSKVATLCEKMSHRAQPNAGSSKFSLVSTEAGTVSMAFRTWTKWYLAQEHQRWRNALNAYWGRGKRLSAQEGATAGSVLREFIDGVQKASRRASVDEVGAEVEVGVFVIRRTRRAG